jgi:hypothetical protein
VGFFSMTVSSKIERKAALMALDPPDGAAASVVKPPRPDAMADTASPLVTIAIPTFNRAELLEGCLGAALAQTYPHFEVLVSDNASADTTPQLLRRFDDRRLRVMRQTSNIGLLPNWNACLAEARGEYIVFVSDDDRISPNLLERCVRTLSGRNDIAIVATLCNIHIASLRHTRSPRTSRTLWTGIHDGRAILREFLNDRITVANCGIMMKTALLRERGGFPLQLPYTADVAAWAPLLLCGDAGLVNEACATGLLHDKSQTARHSIELRLEDGLKAAAIIAGSVDRLTSNPFQRWLLRRQTHRCFARRSLIVLSDYRMSGGSIGKVLRLVWNLRSNLWSVGPIAAMRFAAIVLCPSALADRIRRMRPHIAV